MSVTPTNFEARHVDNPDAETIFVVVNRVGLYYLNYGEGSKIKNLEEFLNQQKAKQLSLNKQFQSNPFRTTGPVTHSMT